MTEKMTPREDLFTRWNVDENHRIHDEEGKTAAEIWKGIVSKLDTEGKILLETLEYISIADTIFDLRCRGWILYTVAGGSEGYYTHLETIREGKLTKLVLIKTLDGRPSRIKLLEGKIWDILDAGK